MRVFILILILAAAGIVNTAFAADDFGSPFADQAPSALSDTPYVEGENPWDIEPAAGDEDGTQEEVDLPASDKALIQLKALEQEYPNVIIDDLSP